MVENIPVPPSSEADARNRGVRTFLQGLGIDIAVALVITLGPLLVGSDFAFSRDYGLTLGLLAAKTVVTAVVSYVTRKLLPPQFVPDREVRPAPDPPPTATQPGPVQSQERPYR